MVPRTTAEEPADVTDALIEGLTVVVLTYNSVGTITACLDSLVAQGDADFDVVVVDDASTDGTLDLVETYRHRLRLTVITNGSHVISRGRNLGFAAATGAIVAYLDSDDAADPGWVKAIKETVAENPDVSLVSGPLVPLARTKVGKAIATNDQAVRRFFGQGAMRFRGGNCAINRSKYPDAQFNEAFRYAEDLELLYRSQPAHQWIHTPSMQVDHSSRDTFGAYALQMYRYGRAKAHVSFRSRDYRAIDFGPLLLVVGGVAIGLRRRSVLPALVLLPFSLAEAAFVAASERCRPREAVLLTPAWLIKNAAWSAGLVHGLVSIAASRELRRTLRREPGRIGQ